MRKPTRRPSSCLPSLDPLEERALLSHGGIPPAWAGPFAPFVMGNEGRPGPLRFEHGPQPMFGGGGPRDVLRSDMDRPDFDHDGLPPGPHGLGGPVRDYVSFAVVEYHVGRPGPDFSTPPSVDPASASGSMEPPPPGAPGPAPGDMGAHAYPGRDGTTMHVLAAPLTGDPTPAGHEPPPYAGTVDSPLSASAPARGAPQITVTARIDPGPSMAPFDRIRTNDAHAPEGQPEGHAPGPAATPAPVPANTPSAAAAAVAERVSAAFAGLAIAIGRNGNPPIGPGLPVVPGNAPNVGPVAEGTAPDTSPVPAPAPGLMPPASPPLSSHESETLDEPGALPTVGADLITGLLPFDRSSLELSLARFLEGLEDEPGTADAPMIGPTARPVLFVTAALTLEAVRRWRAGRLEKTSLPPIVRRRCEADGLS